jgi:hypothetical protein
MTVEALLPTGKLLPMPDPEKKNKSGSGPTEDRAVPPAEAAAPQAPAPQ